MTGLGTLLSGLGASLAGFGAPLAGFGASLTRFGAPLTRFGAPLTRFGALLHKFGAPLQWLFGAALLGWLVRRVSVPEFTRALGEANVPVFLGIVGAATLIGFGLDAAAYQHLISRFHLPISGSEARSLRGLTYLLTPIHWQLGRAGVVARLAQTRGVPIIEGTSTALLYQTLDLVLLSAAGFIGSEFLRRSAGFGGPALDGLAFSLAGLFILSSSYLWVLAAPSVPDWPALARFRDTRLHRSHRKLRAGDAARVFALKLGYFALLGGVYAAGLECFGVSVELARLAFALPLIQAAGALPISPGGLGTQQAAMLLLFAQPGTEAKVIAFGLCLPLLMSALRCGIGALYWVGSPRSNPAAGFPNASRNVPRSSAPLSR